MNHLTPTLLLIFITVVWGWSFVLVKDSLAVYGVISFLAVRFMIASLLMGVLSGRKVTRAALIDGTLVGIPLVASYLAQTFGLRYTTVTNSGLITGLFVVFAPLAYFCCRKWCGPSWIIPLANGWFRSAYIPAYLPEVIDGTRGRDY